MSDKIDKNLASRAYDMARAGTHSMNGSHDERIGFAVGFRLYERVAARLGMQLVDDDCRAVLDATESKEEATQ